jgi:Kef-type K+ transport system membrane component KefB
MFDGILGSLLLVSLIAALSPFVADRVRRWVRIPGVVIEIGLGILIGPHVLDLVDTGEVLSVMAEMGLVFLIFLAGFEVDTSEVRGRPLRLAASAWSVTLVLGILVAVGLHAVDLTSGIRFVAICLTTTAIGTLLPILGDSGVLRTRFGLHCMTSGAMGEIGPIIAISVALTGGAPAHTALVLLAFMALVAVSAILATRPVRPRIVELISTTLHSSAQLGVRLCVVLCVFLVWLAEEFSLDVLLGAFAAGMISRIFLGSTSSASAVVVAEGEVVEEIAASQSGDGHHVVISHVGEVQTRLESLGFGFFIPLFFVVSGTRFNLSAFDSVGAIAKIPMFAVLLLLVRGLPILVYRSELGMRATVALGFLQSAALPLLVVITGLGVQDGLMRSDNAAALVGAGLLSIVVFPIIGLAILERAGAEERVPVTT